MSKEIIKVENNLGMKHEYECEKHSEEDLVELIRILKKVNRSLKKQVEHKDEVIDSLEKIVAMQDEIMTETIKGG